jgi:hypothetical protein
VAGRAAQAELQEQSARRRSDPASPSTSTVGGGAGGRGDAREVVGEGPHVVGPPPGGGTPSTSNLEDTGGCRCFPVLLQGAAAAPSPLSIPSREFLTFPVRMV